MFTQVRIPTVAALAVLTFALSGCYIIPSPSHPIERPFDRLEADRIDRAQHSVWMRTGRFSPTSPQAAALLRACQAGKSVEVLAWQGYASTLDALKGSCVHVYVTDQPQVSTYPDTLLIDSDQLVIYGELSDARGARARQEYEAQAAIKAKQSKRID